MAYTLMIDNNVVLDKFLQREPFFEKSDLVCLLGTVGDALNYVSVAMLTDIYYYLQKEVGSEKAHDMLTDSLAYLKYCDTTSADALYCLEQRWDDFEDCLVARCAENINADYIITRNPQDFARSAVPALTPAELFELLESRDGLKYREIDVSDYL